ncbi:hypothetical protein F441_23020 [Phytophthora nicotianae CJ01A1]|uniref:Uncharacterized protein n=5 Tax=Phytophthora nicotianae TaxID=4792 RepID=W2QP85_PHYN3|nr:hypothetical protein PPTG_22037 [Phytophthora nicotianae INRA-310]ETI54944.1 hypothetical protein F443_02337 [Phytophthora nicotianae P1569]ETO83686.1 hypothetical protein F444_02335 [Phytophthora nicotianae P1976]ETO99564.1 hypothetical protein F441_23020 [Phytophthora nicotianae CJ01A1]ETP28000.1 hypothetical protein F442_22715 [Phytophthora nicotianae P10297]ETN14923.1 hypothetical protein PPTG_22037 [Phytophthora nicotianae INRA-310]
MGYEYLLTPKSTLRKRKPKAMVSTKIDLTAYFLFFFKGDKKLTATCRSELTSI